jgi:hypothetical protein
VESFSESPSEYQTVWDLILTTLPDVAFPRAVSVTRANAFLRSHLAATGPDSLGDLADALYLAALADPSTDSATVKAVTTKAATVASGNGYGAEPGAAASPLATARVVYALQISGASVRPETLQYLRADLSRIARTSNPSPARIGAWALETRELAASHTATGISPTRIARMVRRFADVLTAKPVTGATLPPLTELLRLADSLHLAVSWSAPSLDSSIVRYPRGWYGFSGSVIPDPQLTYYLHRLGVDRDRLSLTSGSTARGWVSLGSPSSTAGALWAAVDHLCGLSYGGSRAALVSEIKRVLAAPDISTPALLDLSFTAQYARFTPTTGQASRLEAQLNASFSSAVAENDVVGGARDVAAAARFGVPTSRWAGAVSSAAPATSAVLKDSALLAIAEHIVTTYTAVKLDGAPDGTVDSLRAGILYRFNPAAHGADLVSTSMALLLTAAPAARRTAALTRFTREGYVCDSASAGCDVSGLDVAAAATIARGALSASSFVW